jgi:hypothetical protein
MKFLPSQECLVNIGALQLACRFPWAHAELCSADPLASGVDELPPRYRRRYLHLKHVQGKLASPFEPRAPME